MTENSNPHMDEREELAEAIAECQRTADRLGLKATAAHLDMAIHTVRRGQSRARH